MHFGVPSGYRERTSSLASFGIEDLYRLSLAGCCINGALLLSFLAATSLPPVVWQPVVSLLHIPECSPVYVSVEKSYVCSGEFSVVEMAGSIEDLIVGPEASVS